MPERRCACSGLQGGQPARQNRHNR